MAGPPFRTVVEFPVGLWRRLRMADAALMAAAVAFNTFFALVPAAVVVVSAASLLADDAALDRAVLAAEPLVPADVAEFVRALIADVRPRLVGRQGWVIVVGVVIALYAGSRAMVAMQRGLARIEGMRETRPRWRIRLIGVGLTLAAAAGLTGSSVLLVAERGFARLLEEATGIHALATGWQHLRIPLAVLGLVLFLRVLYQWGPPRPLGAVWLASLVATAGTVLASLGFGYYLSYARRLGATFGTLGAVAVALVWLYLGALATMVGAALVTSAWRWRRGEPAASRRMHPSGSARPALVQVVAGEQAAGGGSEGG